MKKTIACLIGFLLFGNLLLAQNSKNAQKARHIVLIGSDGFSADIIRNHPGAFPNIEALMREGSYTLEARSVLPSSSAVNWKSMISGAGPEIHGYTEWGSKKPELPSRVTNAWGLFPSIIGETRLQKPETLICAGYTWDGIGYLYEKEAASVNYAAKDDQQLTDSIVSYFVRNKPYFTFVAFAEPDGAGHGHGWESDEYFNACKEIDTYVGEITAAIDKAGGRDNTIIIFTADHGGKGKGHGGKSMNEMQIPFVITGKGIKKGYKIEDSVMQFDCAATIAHIMKITPPQAWIGRPAQTVFGK